MNSDRDIINKLVKTMEEHPDELDKLCTEFENIKMKKEMK